MYDPTIGRFISEDPIGFDAGDPNLTRYVGNDVLNQTDPSGLQPPNVGTVGGGAQTLNPNIDPKVLQQLQQGGTGNAIGTHENMIGNTQFRQQYEHMLPDNLTSERVRQRRDYEAQKARERSEKLKQKKEKEKQALIAAMKIAAEKRAASKNACYSYADDVLGPAGNKYIASNNLKEKYKIHVVTRDFLLGILVGQRKSGDGAVRVIDLEDGSWFIVRMTPVGLGIRPIFKVENPCETGTVYDPEAQLMFIQGKEHPLPRDFAN